MGYCHLSHGYRLAEQNNFPGHGYSLPNYNKARGWENLLVAGRELGVEVIGRDVVNDNNTLRHDPDKLASVLMQLYTERGHSGLTMPIREEAFPAAAD